MPIRFRPQQQIAPASTTSVRGPAITNTDFLMQTPEQKQQAQQYMQYRSGNAQREDVNRYLTELGTRGRTPAGDMYKDFSRTLLEMLYPPSLSKGAYEKQPGGRSHFVPGDPQRREQHKEWFRNTDLRGFAAKAAPSVTLAGALGFIPSMAIGEAALIETMRASAAGMLSTVPYFAGHVAQGQNSMLSPTVVQKPMRSSWGWNQHNK